MNVQYMMSLLQNVRVEVSANERGLLAFFLAKIAKIDPDLIIVSYTDIPLCKLYSHSVHVHCVTVWKPL